VSGPGRQRVLATRRGAQSQHRAARRSTRPSRVLCDGSLCSATRGCTDRVRNGDDELVGRERDLPLARRKGKSTALSSVVSTAGFFAGTAERVLSVGSTSLGRSP